MDTFSLQCTGSQMIKDFLNNAETRPSLFFTIGSGVSFFCPSKMAGKNGIIESSPSFWGMKHFNKNTVETTIIFPKLFGCKQKYIQNQTKTKNTHLSSRLKPFKPPKLGTSAFRKSSWIFDGRSDGHALLEIRSKVEWSPDFSTRYGRYTSVRFDFWEIFF